MVLCPNAVVNIANEMSRKGKLFNFGTLKRLMLLVNVRKRNGQTFISGMRNSGNHWVLVVVELRPFKCIIYCDTLAWEPPSNILEVVNSFTNHIPHVGSYDSSSICTAHSPLAVFSVGLCVQLEMLKLPVSDLFWHMWSHCCNQCSAWTLHRTLFHS